MKAYRIVNWKELAEVNSHGKPAKNTDKRLKKARPKYARWSFQSHSLSPVYKRLSKKAFGTGKLMEAAAIGLFVLLIDIAMDWDDAKLRGWILDDLKRPLDGYGIAELLEMRDKEHVIAALDLLADPEIGLIELVEFDIRGKSGEHGGKKVIEKGSEGEREELMECPLNNETVTENLNRNLNETETGETSHPPGTGANVSPARPPSGKVSVLVSGVSDSVSAMDPSAGGRGIRQAKQQALILFTEIIRPRGPSDITTFQDIFNQLEKKMILETNLDLFNLAIEKARESSRLGNVPAAMFVAAMKEPPFNYVPRGLSVIKGRIDHYRNSK